MLERLFTSYSATLRRLAARSPVAASSLASLSSVSTDSANAMPGGGELNLTGTDLYSTYRCAFIISGGIEIWVRTNNVTTPETEVCIELPAMEQIARWDGHFNSGCTDRCANDEHTTPCVNSVVEGKPCTIKISRRDIHRRCFADMRMLTLAGMAIRTFGQGVAMASCRSRSLNTYGVCFCVIKILHNYVT